jgi:hypothetical protein
MKPLRFIFAFFVFNVQQSHIAETSGGESGGVAGK